MEKYRMENSNSIWQWCKARKKLLTMSKIHSMADGFSSVSKTGSLADGFSPNIIRKGKQCIDDSPINKSSTTSEGNALKSGTHLRNMCLPVQNSIAEVGPKNGDSTKSPVSVIQDYVSSSETNSDAMSDHPHHDSGPGGQLLPRALGIGDESSVEDPAFYQKKQPSKSRIQRRVQKAALKQNRLFSDQGVKDSSGRHAACQREISVVVEDMEFQSQSVNGQMRDLRLVGGCETNSNYINWPCHPPASKRPKRDQGLVSETSKSPFEIENQKVKSEILCPGLHLLADVAVRSLQNDWCRFPENITQKEGVRKAIFIPTALPFWQKRVVRRVEGTLKHHQPDAPQMIHDLQRTPGAAKSKPLLTTDMICNLGSPACIKQSENQVVANGVDEDQMAIPQLRCSKRSRSQGLPSKYCDSVLQPWKRGTRR
jgi:hypothetical protein